MNYELFCFVIPSHKLTVFGLCCIWTVFALHCICNPLYVHSAVLALCCIWTLLRSTVFGLCWTRQFKVGAEGNYMCAAPRLWQLEICSTFTFKIIFPSFFQQCLSLWKSMFHFPPMNICFDWICLSSRFVLKSVCRQDTHPKFWRSDTSIPICHETASWWNCKLN